jgi:hypothetical protein
MNHQLLKWFEVVKLSMVMILASMEDKKPFSNLSFMNNKFKITLLYIHLDLIVRMHVQSFYAFETFPFYTIICD